MTKKKKSVVWYVDDLPENLARFRQLHQELFEVRTFSTPGQVLDELVKSTPDALLCDIFFYDTPDIARKMEEQVKKKAEEIRSFGEEIGASKHLAGVELIQEVTSRFGKKFPVYAYTSKGPYLLENRAFDQIGESGARWLFKGRYSKNTEQIIIRQDVEEFRANNSLTRVTVRFICTALFASGILGGLVVWFLTEKLPVLLQ